MIHRRALVAAASRANAALGCQCAHPRHLGLSASCRWPAGTEVTWWLDESALPVGMDSATVQSEIAGGYAPWSRYSGLKTRQVFDRSEARVIVQFSPIDGPWNILGDTYLPCDGLADAQHTMTLDIAESWHVGFLRRVVMHEAGHSIGAPHRIDGGKAVMDPDYDDAVDDLLQWDVDWVVGVYGPPLVAPDYSQEFTVAAAGPVTIDLTGFVAPSPGRYRVTVSPITP
jgi:hypothetical protein